MRRGTWVLITVLLGASAPGLGAQEPDTVRTPRDPDPRERPEPQRDTAGVQDTVGAATPPGPTFRAPAATFSASLGTFGFDTFQRQVVLAERRNAAGEPLDSAFLGRTVQPDGGLQIRTSGTVAVGDLWSVRLGAAYGWTTFRTAYTGSDSLWVTAARILADRETTDATILSGELALRRWIPTYRRIRTYVELGPAVLRFKTDGVLPGAPELSDGMTRLGGLAAAGGLVPLTDRLSARVQTTARVFRTPVDTAPPGTPGASTSTLALTFESGDARPFADDAHELITAIRLELGLTLGLGAIRGPEAPPEPPDPVGTGGSSPPPGR